MKSIIQNNDAFDIILGFWGILLLAAIVIIFFIFIVATWGVIGLIGLILIVLGFIYEWKSGLGMNPISIGMIIVGMILIFISAYDIGGLEIMQFANPFK